MAKSRVSFPDGTEVEIAKDATPEQITAILQALQGNAKAPLSNEPEHGEVIIAKLTPEEIWDQGSKKEKLALFVRNHFMPDQLFTTVEVRDQQLEFVKRLVFGESSAIATYLNRLHEEAYLVKVKRGNRVKYQLTNKIMEDYPTLELEQIATLLQQTE